MLRYPQMCQLEINIGGWILPLPSLLFSFPLLPSCPLKVGPLNLARGLEECCKLSLTYKVLTTSQPTYLHNLISLQTDNNTRSSDVVTLARPSPASSLKVTDRSFQYVSPHLWNQLPFSLRELVSPLYAYLNPFFCSPLSPSITPSLFHSKLKTYLFLVNLSPIDLLPYTPRTHFLG